MKTRDLNRERCGEGFIQSTWCSNWNVNIFLYNLSYIYKKNSTNY